MIIIKPGNVPERKFTCDECGCEFIASFGEYTTTTLHEHLTKKAICNVYESKCPCCGNTVRD